MQSLKIHNKLKMKYENNALDTLDFEIDTVLHQLECDSASTDIATEISQRVLDSNLRCI